MQYSMQRFTRKEWHRDRFIGWLKRKHFFGRSLYDMLSRFIGCSVVTVMAVVVGIADSI